MCSLLMLAFSCKHKKVQVMAVNKQKSTTPAAPKTKPVPAPAGGAEGELQQKLGLSAKQIRDSKLYAFISDWYGTPYKYGGCLKTGVDCSCFTSMLCETVYKVRMPRSAGEMYSACEKISLEQAREGDLFFFKIASNSISHVGVFLKNKLFVHSSTSRGVIINSVEEAYYKKYFFCAGRIRNS